MAKLHQILPIFVIIAASMVSSQEDYDDSYSSWFDNPRQHYYYYANYYRPYYGNYYSTPPSSYDYENTESRNDYVDEVVQVDPEPIPELTGEDLWYTLSEEERSKIWEPDTIKLTPDFSCYEGLNTEPHRGNEFVTESIEFCERNDFIHWDHCYNGCILYRRFFIMSPINRKYLYDASYVADYMRKAVFANNDPENTDDKAYEIAKRIKDNCGQIAEDLAGRPCNSKAALYECIQDAWSCN